MANTGLSNSLVHTLLEVISIKTGHLRQFPQAGIDSTITKHLFGKISPIYHRMYSRKEDRITSSMFRVYGLFMGPAKEVKEFEDIFGFIEDGWTKAIPKNQEFIARTLEVLSLSIRSDLSESQIDIGEFKSAIEAIALYPVSFNGEPYYEARGKVLS